MSTARKQFDSSLTRVRPGFSALTALDETGRSWFGALLGLASRAPLLGVDEAAVGVLSTPPKFEYQAAPSAPYLRWLVSNATELDRERLLSAELNSL